MSQRTSSKAIYTIRYGLSTSVPSLVTNPKIFYLSTTYNNHLNSQAPYVSLICISLTASAIKTATEPCRLNQIDLNDSRDQSRASLIAPNDINMLSSKLVDDDQTY